MIHFKIPMLFYDYYKRTYKFTEWTDVNSNTQREKALFLHHCAEDESFPSNTQHQKKVQEEVQNASRVDICEAMKRIKLLDCSPFSDEMLGTSSTEVSITSDLHEDFDNNHDDFFNVGRLRSFLQSNNKTWLPSGHERMEGNEDCDSRSCSNGLSLSLTSPIDSRIQTVPFVSLDIQWDSVEKLNNSYPDNNSVNEENQYVDNLCKDSCNLTSRSEDRVATRIGSNKKNTIEFCDSANVASTMSGMQTRSLRQKLEYHGNKRLDVQRRIQNPGECLQSEPALIQQHVTLRIPIPTYISYESYDSATCMNTIEEIFDPTEPLIYGSLNDIMCKSLNELASQFYDHLIVLHKNDTGTATESVDVNSNIEDVVCSFIRSNPVICQVKYHIPGYVGPCYPLSFFSSIGFVQGLETAYLAYPEAIGLSDSLVGTPLQYALVYRQPSHVIETLLRLFPESVRLTNHGTEKRTPLHLACSLVPEKSISTTGCLYQPDVFPDRDVIELLKMYYPSAVQIADNLNGMTPLHYVCQWNQSQWSHIQLSILHSFFVTSPMAIHAVTTDMQKPLHIASRSGAPTNVLALIIEYDPSQVKCTDDHFQTPLHKAILAAAKEDTLKIRTSSNKIHERRQQAITLRDNVALLARIWPNAISVADANDDTPIQLAYKLGLCHDDHIVTTLLQYCSM